MVVHSCSANQEPERLIDLTLDSDYNLKVSSSDCRPLRHAGGRQHRPPHAHRRPQDRDQRGLQYTTKQGWKFMIYSFVKSCVNLPHGFGLVVHSCATNQEPACLLTQLLT